MDKEDVELLVPVFSVPCHWKKAHPDQAGDKRRGVGLFFPKVETLRFEEYSSGPPEKAFGPG